MRFAFTRHKITPNHFIVHKIKRGTTNSAVIVSEYIENAAGRVSYVRRRLVLAVQGEPSCTIRHFQAVGVPLERASNGTFSGPPSAVKRVNHGRTLLGSCHPDVGVQPRQQQRDSRAMFEDADQHD